MRKDPPRIPGSGNSDVSNREHWRSDGAGDSEKKKECWRTESESGRRDHWREQFVGCKPCAGYGDYPADKCIKHMERAFNFNFADTSTILHSSEVFWTESLTKHHTLVLTYEVNPLYLSLHGY
ncbi:hypothetical protein O6H91_01G054000 [Diphasiastrum complanatum]|uniref:Uncharacterized protein n=1 Tax=Diphasiastrum complanatum TaxID=34168 RepID=A0ACC2ER45_DIPCM|nr:hypothetical protein O6H91_01G054000 [Diphasiastrum complanatum]